MDYEKQKKTFIGRTESYVHLWTTGCALKKQKRRPTRGGGQISALYL